MEPQILATFTLPSRPGGEQLAMEKVAAAVSPLHLEKSRLERLKTAVSEATMNAMEHGNHYQEDKPVTVRVLNTQEQIVVQIEDLGGEAPISSTSLPDLDAKLQGLQSPRGWGLFLIQNMVDEMNTIHDGDRRIVELVFKHQEKER